MSRSMRLAASASSGAVCSKRAVEIDDDRRNVERKFPEAHYFLTFASSARISPMTVS